MVFCGKLYLVKIGSNDKKPIFYRIFTVFRGIPGPETYRNGGAAPCAARPFTQNPSTEVIHKWHKKFSLWRLCCVTLTSL